MIFALIRNAVNFYLPFVDDSVDAVEVECDDVHIDCATKVILYRTTL